MRKETISKKYIYEKCIEGIDKYNPSSLNELLNYLKPYFSRITFYNKIKTDSKEYADIIEKLEHKKTVFANTLKDKFYEMNNFKSLELLFKLYCTKEDREALAQKFDVNTNQNINYEDVKKLEVNINKLSIEEQRMLNALLDKIRDE